MLLTDPFLNPFQRNCRLTSARIYAKLILYYLEQNSVLSILTGTTQEANPHGLTSHLVFCHIFLKDAS